MQELKQAEIDFDDWRLSRPYLFAQKLFGLIEVAGPLERNNLRRIYPEHVKHFEDWAHNENFEWHDDPVFFGQAVNW